MSDISAIRKAVPGTSLVKAKQALVATWEDSAAQASVEAALKWLEQDRASTGAKKAEKLADREANEGLVGIWIDADGITTEYYDSKTIPAPPLAGIVELKCETDFVARNDLFVKLLKDLANSAAHFLTVHPEHGGSHKEATSKVPDLVDVPWEHFKDFPHVPVDLGTKGDGDAISVENRLVDVISRLGEKITVGRVSALRSNPIQSRQADEQAIGNNKPIEGELKNELFLASAFTHGSVPSPQQITEKLNPGTSFACGKVASLLVTHFKGPQVEQMRANKDVITALGRCLARQSVGLDTKTVRAVQGGISVEQGDPESTSLYSQPFMMLLPTAQVESSGEESVQTVLKKWADKHAQGGSVEVKDMRRWSLNDKA